VNEGQDEGEIKPEELVEDKSGAAPPASSRSRRRDPLIGATLDGRYEVQRLIARGGMGRIYSAEQSALGRKVALKVMDLGYSEDLDPDFQKRFFLEASTCAQLSHPNTIRVFDYGADGDICFIAMELIQGKTLLQAIHDSAPFGAERTLHIARQICGSLSEAHGKGIIHRDLKPSNVLLTQHGEEKDYAKVLDFGLVKLLREDAQEITRSGLFLGSPNYMSPEQIRSKDVDQRSDLYSLGVILFMALTGRAPFKRDSSINVLLAQLEEAPPMLADVAPNTDASAALQWTVMTCLEKDANARFGSVDELNKAFKACQQELRGEIDAPLHLRLEAGSVVVSTVPPGMDPMRAHGLQGSLRTGAQEDTVETSALDLPRPTFGYTPSVGSQSRAGWSQSSSVRRPPGSPMPIGTQGSRPFTDSDTVEHPSAVRPPMQHPPSLAPRAAPVPTAPVRGPLQAEPTPIAPESTDSKRKRRKAAPPPTFWEKYGVLSLSLLALLLAIAAVGLLIEPRDDGRSEGQSLDVALSTEVTVPLVTEPTNASVLKDGALLGTTPLDLVMPAGATWELVLSAPGWESRTVTVSSSAPPAPLTLTSSSNAPPDLVPVVKGTPTSPAADKPRPRPSTNRPAPRVKSTPATAQPAPAQPASEPAAEPEPDPTPARKEEPTPAAEEPTPKKMRMNDVRDPWAN